MTRRRDVALSGLLSLTIFGCSLGPNFVPPKQPGLSGYKTAFPRDAGARPIFDPATDPDPNWWEGMGDPVLTQLERKAIAGNLNLQEAILRIAASRQNETISGAAGLPTLSGTGSYTREQLGAKGILEDKGVYKALGSLSDPHSPINQKNPTLGPKLQQFGNNLVNQLTQPVDLYSYGLTASWQIDLFGMVRRSVEEAKANTLAQAESTNDSLVTLEGQVAQAYVQLRAAQALVASQRESIASAQSSLDLTRRQKAGGISTQIDVDQAATQLGSLQAQLPSYEKQAEQSVNQLNVLVGQPPGALDAMLAPVASLPKIPDVVGIGLPASLARRRPDIRQAEAQLHAATAGVGVAVASFYPSISLKGMAGLRALDASYLTNWASLFYSFGPAVTLPIFEGGKLTATLRMARAQEAAAALAYRQAVLNALSEVENALVAYRADRQARDSLAATVGESADALYLSRNSYRHGLTSFLNVLQSERSWVQARQQLIQTDMQMVDDIITLYNALGGGWQQTEASSQVPRIDPSTPFLPAALDRAAAGKAP